jgi:hypothetical protein
MRHICYQVQKLLLRCQNSLGAFGAKYLSRKKT